MNIFKQFFGQDADADVFVFQIDDVVGFIRLDVGEGVVKREA